jgi:hypothetical protein
MLNSTLCHTEVKPKRLFDTREMLRVQIWATRFFYATLVDLGDVVTDRFGLPFDHISLEILYRGSYHVSRTYSKGLATFRNLHESMQTRICAKAVLLPRCREKRFSIREAKTMRLCFFAPLR